MIGILSNNIRPCFSASFGSLCVWLCFYIRVLIDSPTPFTHIHLNIVSHSFIPIGKTVKGSDKGDSFS